MSKKKCAGRLHCFANFGCAVVCAVCKSVQCALNVFQKNKKCALSCFELLPHLFCDDTFQFC